jgi:hypothetical protein
MFWQKSMFRTVFQENPVLIEGYEFNDPKSTKSIHKSTKIRNQRLQWKENIVYLHNE